MMSEGLLPPSAKGRSCALTIKQALEDTQLRPEVLHLVGCGDAERSLDLEVLRGVLPEKAQIFLVGPHAQGAKVEPKEERWGPVEKSGFLVSIFPQTYQRFMVQEDFEVPQLAVLFHPGLDVHYFTWYPCLRFWTEKAVPLLFTAYRVPGGLGETPQTVKSFLECLVGTGGGQGLWVIEDENPYAAEDGSFNAGYYVTLGSQGALPVLAEEMYWPLFQALQKIGHPFAPRVGYLDLDDGKVSPENLNLLSSIAEGALRGAMAGDGTDEETARAFAMKVLDQVLGAGKVWATSGFMRLSCSNCGEGYDSEAQHFSVCPAAGKELLTAGDEVQVVGLERMPQLNGKVVQLQSFLREKQRWQVSLEGRKILLQASKLQK